jgi:hypothetical protein
MEGIMTIGLGISSCLLGEPSAPRLLTTKTGVDHTARMGLWCVKVYDKSGSPSRRGVGVFARGGRRTTAA